MGARLVKVLPRSISWKVRLELPIYYEYFFNLKSLRHLPPTHQHATPHATLRQLSTRSLRWFLRRLGGVLARMHAFFLYTPYLY